MMFEEALKLMREGKPVRQTTCGSGLAIALNDNSWLIDASNILATDWEDASDNDIDKPAGEDT